MGGLFNSLLDLIVLYGLCALLKVSLKEFAWMKLYYVSTVTLSKLLSVLLAWIFHRIRKPVNNQKIERKWILLTILFPLVSYAMLAVVYVSFQNGNDLSLGAVIFSGFLVVANIAIIYIIGIMEKSTRSAQENALLHQEMDIQTNSIKALERSYRDQRKATHEYRNQLQTIHDLLVAGKETEAKNYIEQLQGLQTTRILAVNSHHAIVDAVLNHKYQTAKENDIDLQIQINNLSTLSIATDELVVLLSNLFDNAIEACCRVSGYRVIQCSILLEDTFFISVRNSSIPVSFVGDSIPTSKSPKEEHGYGLSRIKLILNQLGAEYSFAYENGWFEFVTEIPISG